MYKGIGIVFRGLFFRGLYTSSIPFVYCFYTFCIPVEYCWYKVGVLYKGAKT